MLFDPSLNYVDIPSSDERKKIAAVVLNERSRTILKISNVAANVLIPAFVCIATQCNMILIFAAFLIADIVMNLMDHYLITVRPHAILRDGLLSEVKNHLKTKVEQRDALIAKIEAYKNTTRKKDLGSTEQYRELCEEKELLDFYINQETKWIEQKLIPYKEEELKAMQKPVKDYSDKKLFFKEFDEKLHSYISVYGLQCLKPVSDSIIKMMSTLDKKPHGYDMIPNMMYVYIGELQSVLVKIGNLDRYQIEEHVDDLVRASNALSNNIDRLVDRINTSDSESIDVGLSVLIQELEKEMC